MPPRRPSTPRRRRPTSKAVRAAAERAVERVLSSRDAVELLVRRLEAAGWHIEREVAPPSAAPSDTNRLTPSARAR